MLKVVLYIRPDLKGPLLYPYLTLLCLYFWFMKVNKGRHSLGLLKVSISPRGLCAGISKLDRPAMASSIALL